MLTGLAIGEHYGMTFPGDWVFFYGVLALIVLVFTRMYVWRGRSRRRTAHRSGRQTPHQSGRETAHSASHEPERAGDHGHRAVSGRASHKRGR